MNFGPPPKINPTEHVCAYCGTPPREHKHSGKCLSCGAPLNSDAPHEKKSETGARLDIGIALSTTYVPGDYYSPYGNYIDSGTGPKRRR